MPDIYISESDDNCFEQLKSICIGYLIQKNYEASVYRYADVPVESAAIYMLIFNDDTEKVSMTVRNINKGSYIIVLIDSMEKITKAVTPGIAPSGVIIKPWRIDDVNTVLDEVYNDFLRLNSSDSLGNFVFRVKAKDYSIPYERILFFESRNKKIIIRTELQEIEFYGTLDSILEETPDCFIKIHKSFVINFIRLATADFGKMTVEFDEGTIVYMSRTYKAELKKRLDLRRK